MEPIVARRLMLVVALAVLALGATAWPAMARTISWSGYAWDVRPAGFGAPGPNHWSDSEANVRVDGGDLVLATVRDAAGRWTSAEVDNRRHLGYGTYRWVVASDLSALDADEVLGMFTYGGSSPSNNEIDIEPSHWGNTSWPTGSVTVWQDADAGRSISKTFRYSPRAPYVNQFTWLPGRITYLVTDAAGTTLLRWTATTGVPVPSSEVPVINYWRFAGAPPAGARSMRITSFSWTPPGRSPPPAGTKSPGVARAAPLSCRVRLRPVRFRAAGRRHGALIAWTASAPATLRLSIQRRLRRRGYVPLGRLVRPVHAGSGNMRFSGRVGGRRLRPGAYRLTAGVRGGARCAPGPLRFAVVPR